MLRSQEQEQGTALLLALILLMLLGLAGAQALNASGNAALRASEDSRQSTLAADCAIAKTKAVLLTDPAQAWDMSPGDAQLVLDEDRAQVTLTCLARTPPGPVFLLESKSGPVRVHTWIRLRLTATPTASASWAAVISTGDVELTGNVVADGRDHGRDGLLTGDPGVLGVLAGGAIQAQGNAQIGGVGAAPTHPGAPGALDPNSSLWTEADSNDGIDNDGDGLIDEAGPPANAEAMLGRPAGSLRSLAEASGTYFTSRADYEAWRQASNPQAAGGKVIYLDFPANAALTSLRLPDNAVLDSWGSPRLPPPAPSILVATRVGGGLEVGPLHAPEGFQGVAVVDRLRNANGTGSLIGVLAVLEGSTHTLGNGALRVLYSSEVLASLPGDPQVEIEFLYWAQR